MLHILLVEDYLPLARLLNLDLAEMGYQVSTYQTGEAALEALELLTPDLVLLDWRLPGISGLEVCRQFRRAGYSQPILFVTAMAEAANVRAGLAAGADDYLIKPFTPQALLRSIADHLNPAIREDSPAA